MKKIFHFLLYFFAAGFFLAPMAFGESEQAKKQKAIDIAIDFHASLKEEADKGNSHAQTILGLVCLRGVLPTMCSSIEGLVYFEKAAEQENPDAQFILGLAYWKGEVAAKNKEEAIHWLSKAAANGSEGALKALEKIRKKRGY